MPDTRSATPGPRRAARLLAPGARSYLMASALFVVAFGIGPFSIYADAGDNWGFPYYQTLYISVFGLIVCLATFIVIRLIALAHVGAAAALSAILFCAGVFLLLAHVYAPVELGPLVGSAMVSDEPLLDSVIEAVSAVLLILVLVQLLRGRGRQVAALFSLALVAVALGYLGAFAYADRDPSDLTNSPVTVLGPASDSATWSGQASDYDWRPTHDHLGR